MKKFVSILLAVTMLACATSAMAAISTGEVKSRSVTTVFATLPENVSSMPTFLAGDEVRFTISGVQKGDWITLLTYKHGEEPDNTTVQYVDQYTAEGETQEVVYLTRDIGDGVYDLNIKSNGNDLYTVYYQLGEGGEEPPAEVKYGDVNGDGSITAKDNAFLSRYLAKWIGYEEDKINTKNADVDDNGKLNSKDDATLARYLAKWIGYEALPKK